MMFVMTIRERRGHSQVNHPYIQDDSIAGFPLVESPVQRKPVIDENVGTDGVPENGINDGRCRLSFLAEKLK